MNCPSPIINSIDTARCYLNTACLIAINNKCNGFKLRVGFYQENNEIGTKAKAKKEAK
jgi:hypothetical protein